MNIPCIHIDMRFLGTLFFFLFVFFLLCYVRWNCMHPMLHEFDRRLRWYEGIDFIPRDWFKATSLYK